MTTTIFWHPDIALHDQHNHHLAMVPNRLPTIQAELGLLGLQSDVRFEESFPATDAAILAVHSREHLQFLRDNAPETNIFVIDMDTAMTPYTLRTIYLSSGAVLNAVDAVLAGMINNAFCLVYGGHHAGPNRAHGFCFINNIAIGAMYAVGKGAKVAIVDFDTHGGNGTVWAVRDHPDIFFAETYQPGFPGKIISDYDRPSNIMRRLALNRSDWLRFWQEDLLPAVSYFQPDLILVSAGFDAHEHDPLGVIGVKDEDYVWLTSQLTRIQPRIVSALEGGYSLPDTARCARLHVEELSKS